jgi:uncharacterized protein
VRRREDGREPPVSATLAVAVVTRASRDGVAGCEGGIVRIRLTAPPVEDRANEALVRFLAERLDVSRAAVTLAAGGRSRRKIVRIRGLSRNEVIRRLGLLAAEP